MIGSMVGNYRIVRELGSGAMGTVYEGVDTLVERLVAIKVLRADLAKQADLVERFRSEAVTLARLNHPNVALLYNFFQQDGEYFMAMEYVQGHPLESLIINSQPLEPVFAASIMSQALDGLGHAHRMAVLHRDIKPANIMIMAEGRVKVTDFGIARVLGSSRATRHGRIIGTLEYIAPERIRGDESDPRSDLYSAGVVLYEMLAGRLPFTGQTDYELLKAHLEQEPPALQELAGHSAPEPWNAVVHRALAKSPADRFATAEEFREEVLAVAGQTGLSDEQAVKARSFPNQLAQRTQGSKLVPVVGRPPRLLLLIAAVVLLILGAAVAARLRTMHERRAGPPISPLVKPFVPTPAPIKPDPTPEPRPPEPNPNPPAPKPLNLNPPKPKPQRSPEQEAREASMCALNGDTSPRCKDLIRKQTLRRLQH